MAKDVVALSKFSEGFNCAQAVLYAFAEESDIDTALKIACGFGGGMGKTQNVCGAVSGGIMALGLTYGRGSRGSREDIDRTYVKVQKFIKMFEHEKQALTCFDILDGCNTRTPEGQARFKNENLRSRCENCVALACRLVESLLQEID